MAVRKSLALALAVAGASSPVAVGGLSSPALAGVAQPPLHPPSGFHVFGAGGGGWFHQDQKGGFLTLATTFTSITEITGVADGSYNLSGGLVGGGVGYDFVQGRWVFGVEADDSWTGIKGSGTCGFNGAFPHACGGDIRWLATVRGRLGWDLGPLVSGFGDTVVYATGGLAVADIHAWDSLFGTSGDKTATGWTIGATLETMLNSNWSVRLEYLHVDFGNPAVFSAVPPIPEHVSTSGDIVRAGLTYYFSAPPPPPPSPILTKAPRVTK
jgi:outer membrane immunogenic protein